METIILFGLFGGLYKLICGEPGDARASDEMVAENRDLMRARQDLEKSIVDAVRKGAGRDDIEVRVEHF